MENQAQKYEFDKLDRAILKALRADARCSFLDLARTLKVAGGTIHQRVDKMRDAGVIRGFTVDVDSSLLGFGVSALIGIHLRNAKDAAVVFAKLERLPEVVETYYTTGTYAAILKIEVPDIPGLQNFLMEKLQSLQEIQSTESFVILSTPIKRTVI
jgi:Lrp/AsnC family transcriptional regulator, regulator for asnA, asnC and gidA